VTFSIRVALVEPNARMKARKMPLHPILSPIVVSLILSGPTGLRGSEIPSDAFSDTSIPSEDRQHAGQVTALVFSPGGKYLASSGVDGRICFWNLEKHNLAFTVLAHKDGVFALAFSPDGKILASAGADKIIRLWDPQTGSEIGALQGHKDNVACLAFSDDGKTLASGGYDKTIRLWNLSLRREIHELKVDGGRITTIHFGRNGTSLISGGVSKMDIRVGGNLHQTSQADNIRLWNLKNEKEARSYRARGSSVCVTSEDTYALCAGSIVDVQRLANGSFAMDGFHLITLLDLASGQIAHQIPFRGQALCLSADDKVFASAQGSWLHTRGFGSIGPNGSNARKTDTSLCVWEFATATKYLTFPEKHATVIAFSPSGIILAAATAQGQIILYDLRKELTRKRNCPIDLKNPGQKSLEELWEKLADLNPEEGYLAVYLLTYFPEQTVRFLKDRLTPVPKTETARVNKLLTDIQEDDFSVRRKALQDLTSISWGIQPILKRLEGDARSADFQVHLRSLIGPFPKTAGRDLFLRQSRAIQVLELIGSKEAITLLKNLARGEPFWRPTQEAQDALARLKNGLERN
jgi:WD40 repeat protein